MTTKQVVHPRQAIRINRPLSYGMSKDSKYLKYIF